MQRQQSWHLEPLQFRPTHPHIGVVAGGMEDIVAVGGAITGAGLPLVQSSVGCSLRLTIMGRLVVIITGLRREMRWTTACSASNHMIPVVVRI